MTIEITTPVGRLVQGHPMVRKVVKDRKTGLPKLNTAGSAKLVEDTSAKEAFENGN